MAQDESGRPDREQVNKMINAIIRAIIDESPWVAGAKEEVTDDVTKIEEERVVCMDVPLMAMAFLIAATWVQSKAVENRIATKGFVQQIADLIEHNIKTLRDSGDETPFAPQTGMFRTDQRH